MIATTDTIRDLDIHIMMITREVTAAAEADIFTTVTVRTRETMTFMTGTDTAAAGTVMIAATTITRTIPAQPTEATATETKLISSSDLTVAVVQQVKVDKIIVTINWFYS